MAFLAFRKLSPLRTIMVTGTVSMLIIVSGATGFFYTRTQLLENHEKKHQAYLDLINFRGKLSEYSVLSYHVALHDQDRAAMRLSKNQLLSELYRMTVRLHEEFSQTGMPSEPMFAAEMFTQKNFDRDDFRLKVLRRVNQLLPFVENQSRASALALVSNDEYFLFFILAVLLGVSMSAGWLLHHHYKMTMLPLSQLVNQLKLLNSNLPESIRSTAEEMKRELIESGHSRDIAEVTESIVRFCSEIDAKNRKLDEIYIRDEKTHLYNYRHFKEHLIIDIERAKRLGDEVSLVMIDIDDFKLYNDTFGHIAGDQALQKLADLITAQCRTYDVPSRFGGEEFALLFPKTDIATAGDIAGRLRELIAQTSFVNSSTHTRFSLTVSIGIAAFPEDGGDWHTLINNADRALYRAKALGKNQVVLFRAASASGGTV